MAFKGASESEAVQRQVRRAADEGVKPAPWAVVGFRVGPDNAGRRRVFRRVWTFRDKGKASTAFYGPAHGCTYRALVENGNRVAECGDISLVNEWLGTRRGVNKNADPFLAGTYQRRAWSEPEATYMHEGRDLRHLTRAKK